DAVIEGKNIRGVIAAEAEEYGGVPAPAEQLPPEPQVVPGDEGIEAGTGDEAEEIQVAEVQGKVPEGEAA
ncbi:MAG: hypothetical protein ACM3S0_16525, partial [Acidobacteriota bacterium]